MANSQVSVGTSATQIIAKNFNRINLEIYNPDGSAAVFVGESGVTTSTGIPIAAGATKSWTYQGGHHPFFYRGAVYGVVASGTISVQVWEQTEVK
jgi:hypothetical protein